MARPLLLVLLWVAALASMAGALPAVSHALDGEVEGRDEPGVESRPWRGPPRPRPSTLLTTTTLTTVVPAQTFSSSFSLGEPAGTPSGTTLLSTATPTGSPNAGDSQAPSTVNPQPSSEGLGTDTMPTETTILAGPASTAGTSTTPYDGDSGNGSNRTLVITLSTVLPAVGLALIAAAVLLCRRRRRRRLPFLSRGASPIDDDEIETWKSPRDEKAGFQLTDTDAEAGYSAFDKETGAGSGPSHAKRPSQASVKKPPSVIVYSRASDTHAGRYSTDAESRRSFAHNHPGYSSGKTSFDKALPQTPIQARAPNARAGLTDESVPGDEPFIYSPKRTPSRLSKLPPSSSMGRRAHHARARSSRSSTRSFGEYHYSYGSTDGVVGGGRSRAGSDLELSPRFSHDQLRHQSHHHQHHHSRSYGPPRGSHSRVYSSSSIPPRLSFGDEVLLGGLSPTRGVEIGRAIG